MDLPAEERRTFLEIHTEENDEPRLLQLDPHTRFANVFTVIGPGALYWGDRRVTHGDTPARLHMPRGVDSAVDLYFEPASRGESSTAAYYLRDGRRVSDDGDDENRDDRHIGSAFDPSRQGIPEVLPARFSPAREEAEDRRDGGTRGCLISPSLPPAKEEGRARAAASFAHLWRQRAVPLSAMEEAHHYTAAPPLPSRCPRASNLLHPYGDGVASTAPSTAGRARAAGSVLRPQSQRAARGNAAIAAPPASALVDPRHRSRQRRSWEDEARDLRRELQRHTADRRRENGAAAPASVLPHDKGLVQTPPKERMTRRSTPSSSVDVEELAEELHFRQMRRLLELRALRSGRVPASYS